MCAGQPKSTARTPSTPAVLRDGIDETKTREPLEVTVVRVEFHAVFDGEGGEVRVSGEAGGDTRCSEELPHDAEVPRSGFQDRDVLAGEPLVDEIQCRLGSQGILEDGGVRHQTDEAEYHGPGQP